MSLDERFFPFAESDLEGSGDTTPASIGADALIDELEYAILGVSVTGNLDRVRAAKAALRSALASAAQPFGLSPLNSVDRLAEQERRNRQARAALDRMATASAAQPADNITASEAVFAFAAWLTCRSEAVTLGSAHDAAPAAELAGAFVASQGLTQPRDDYHQRLRPYPAAAPKAAPAPATHRFKAGDRVRIASSVDEDLYNAPGRPGLVETMRYQLGKFGSVTHVNRKGHIEVLVDGDDTAYWWLSDDLTPPTAATPKAAPAAQGDVRQLLTEGQIWDWWRGETGLEDCDLCKFPDFARVVRAVEAHAAKEGGKP